MFPGRAQWPGASCLTHPRLSIKRSRLYAAENPAELVAESADTSAPEERRARKDAIKSDNASRADRPAKPSRDDRQDRPRRDDRRHRRDDDVNDGTIGFGDDMPAFMKIAAKV